MRQKRHGGFGAYIFLFLLMCIISLIIFVAGLNGYMSEKSRKEATQEETRTDTEGEQEKEIEGETQTETETETEAETEIETETEAEAETEKEVENEPQKDTDIHAGDQEQEADDSATEENTGETDENLGEEISDETNDELNEETNQTEEEASAEDFVGRRMYKQLTEEEQGIYKTVQQTLANQQDTCVIEQIMGNDEQAKKTLLRAIDAVYYDYPEYFWFNHASQWRSWLYDGYVRVELTLCSYDYWEYVLDKKAYIDAVHTKAEEIANMARKFDDTFDRVKFVHDYLVTYAEYDYVALEEITQTVQRASSQQSHSVYGCLVSQLAVCDGYAKSFQMIMNLLGIDCEYIEGDAGGPHAWNYIVLEDENYWMDVTWDDYDRRDDEGNMAYPNGVDYAYFCITSDTLDDTHTPNATFAVPQCDATEYNFFYHENSHLDQYSFEALSAGAEEQKEAQIVSFRFGSANAMEQAIQDLFTVNHRYTELPYVGNREMMYSYDNTRNILMFLYE